MATRKLSAHCHAADSVLVLIDIQTRLAAAMSEEARRKVLHNAAILLQTATLLDIPVLVSEQYPKGLGKTMPSLTHYLPAGTQHFEKTCFSAMKAKGFQPAIKKLKRPQIILTGMETHVCVLQTALELTTAGWQVFVVEDAVCSRNASHSAQALTRLHAAGVIISTTESVVFEWLGDAKHPHFKSITALIR